MENALVPISRIVILLLSVVIHEISHGLVAHRLGDPTAKLAGRLTMNPLKHLDFFGSFILPISLFLLTSGAFIFGWAKPVPYNPLNLKNPRIGERLIAGMGPASNFLLAGAFSLILLVLPLGEPERNAIAGATLAPSAVWLERALATPLMSFGFFISQIIFINILLGIFNLVPIPPLDGSKVLFSLLPRGADALRSMLEQYGLPLLLLFIFFGFGLITPIIQALFLLLSGVGSFF
ncbi:MAG: site-2 protease family protein [bacterium]|nr:site-2 protease family protein [bacterium]